MIRRYYRVRYRLHPTTNRTSIMAKKIKQYSNYMVVEENGVFIASAPDLDLVCEGKTEEEALNNLQEALALYFEDLPGPADG